MAEARGKVSSASARHTGGSGRNPGGTESPRIAVTGTGTISSVGAGSAVSTRAWGNSIAAQPGDRHAASRISPTGRRARMRWCEPLRYTKRGGAGASVRGSVVQASAVRHGLPTRPRARSLVGFPTGMIEGLTMSRQYSPHKKFQLSLRNIRKPVGRLKRALIATGRWTSWASGRLRNRRADTSVAALQLPSFAFQGWQALWRPSAGRRPESRPAKVKEGTCL